MTDDRDGKRSTVTTSQQSAVRWLAYLNDSMLANAILDRVLHAPHELALAGESLGNREKGRS